jgi:hypothetical protein
MGYARHIGRVGALAVTLGVGVALASSPGIAYADTSGSSSTGDSSSTSTSSSTNTSDSRDTASKDAADDTESSASEADDDASAAEDADDENAADEETPAPEQDGDSSDRATSSRSASTDASDEEDEPSAAAETEESTEADVDSAEETSALVSVATNEASTALQPLVEPGPESPPVQAPVMLAALAALRDELQRNTVQRNATTPTPQAISLLADDTPNVLLIGVDGTNLSRVLADPTNANFFTLIQGGTTAPASIAGHTTISNPSWSSILTGAWGEKTGVINNVFTPWTYDKWPTVFNQLEENISGIETTSIANWDVISGIANAGSSPADNIVNIAQIAGDTDWLLTDDAVGDATEAAIAGADLGVPNFVFSYFVGIDENGHMYGGASDQYALAIENFDRNLGEILEAVSNSGEQWTIIMVTDHGHQPEKGIGHGFQSPDETSTFVIANGPGIFDAGAINLQGEIVDVTPTVMKLFGGPPPADTDGVSLTDLDDSNVFPVDDDEALRAALLDAIGMYGYPDIGTQVVLGLRTIVTSVPYFVYTTTFQLTSGLQALADQDIFLISLLAELAIVPVQFIGDLAYVATNVVAQIVAGLTGVSGASIFPLWPPVAPPYPSTPEEATTLDAYLVCGDASRSAAVLWCGDNAIAV